MNKKLSVAIDIGTTNTKISLYNLDNLKTEDTEKFRTYKINDDYGELFDVASIYKEIVKVINQFAKEHPGNIDSINIASIGEVGVLLDNNFERVTDAIAWYDSRSSEFIERLTEKEKEKIYRITGLPAHTNYVVSKIKWLYEYAGINKSSQYVWAHISDYIAYLLTGKLNTEYSLASRTMAYNIQEKDWSDEILDIFKIRNFVTFPEVISSGETVGYTDKSVVKALKNETIAVKISGHDHMVGADGINLKENELLNSTGTTEGLLYVSSDSHISLKNYEKYLSSGIHVNPKLYTLFSSIPTGGVIFEWFQNLFNINFKNFVELSKELYIEYTKGERNLIDALMIIPHLNGSGSPFKNNSSKGMFYGMTTNTNRKDILFGILVGLSLELAYVSKNFPLENVDRIIVIGPATKNRLWLQLKADFLNKELVSVNVDEAVSLGALGISSEKQHTTGLNQNIIKPNMNNIKQIKNMIKNYDLLYKTKKKITLNNNR